MFVSGVRVQSLGTRLFFQVVIVFCTLIFFPLDQTVTVDCGAPLCAGTQLILAKPTQQILTTLQVFPENENFTLKIEYFWQTGADLGHIESTQVQMKRTTEWCETISNAGSSLANPRRLNVKGNHKCKLGMIWIFCTGESWSYICKFWWCMQNGCVSILLSPYFVYNNLI